MKHKEIGEIKDFRAIHVLTQGALEGKRDIRSTALIMIETIVITKLSTKIVTKIPA